MCLLLWRTVWMVASGNQTRRVLRWRMLLWLGASWGAYNGPATTVWLMGPTGHAGHQWVWHTDYRSRVGPEVDSCLGRRCLVLGLGSGSVRPGPGVGATAEVEALGGHIR